MWFLPVMGSAFSLSRNITWLSAKVKIEMHVQIQTWSLPSRDVQSSRGGKTLDDYFSKSMYRAHPWWNIGLV